MEKTKRSRIETINLLLHDYYESEDPFEQTELAIKLIDGHIVWLLEMAKVSITGEEK